MASRSAWTARAGVVDNIFVERLWRSLKYEEVYLNAYASVAEAKAGMGPWLSFYLRLGRQQGTAAQRNGAGRAGCLGPPRRARREQGAALCRVLVRRQDLEDRAP